MAKEELEKKGKKMFDPAMKCPSCGEPMLFQIGGGRVKCYNCGEETGDIDNLEMYKSSHGTSSLEDFIPPGAKDEDEYELYDQMESMGDMPSDMQLHKALKKADTNDNGKIEEDEMADFQKSLDDYASKNKKGREDIPATYKR